MSYVALPERYDRMQYNRVGRSGLKLPALSLGLWHNFGHERPYDTQRAIVRRAFDLGVTHFDLANNYGPPPGSAEVNFGRILADDLAPYRDELIISSKAGYDMWPGPYGEWGSRKYVLSSLDQSLGRLGLDYVDIFYSHRPDPETPIEETMGALATAVRQGKALYVGISNYDPDQTRAAAAALEAEGVPLLIHQPRYSMFDRHIEDGLFPALEEVGAASIVFSPLAQGLLTDRYLGGDVPADSRAATSRFLSPDTISGEYLERARALDAIAKERGQTLAQLALTWVLRQPLVASALIGASSVAQLEQNIAALDAAPLTGDEIERIEPFAAHGTVLG
ncbi:L-glyceraldehyde 3-phosphate reductase [Agromyces hippuratus]|uniref:L-glyceraldehyde 3-phosphate reductase n=1 Tax=Agromyces hippuratus TaxID=286438 RepID=A0A852X2E0_9MICO|nr:aldo/keto reductase [Agromyces hippuratus]NYG20255.1 L-glyceraldehyde 3-phosphate reductase [Agromyces hippuratus]